MAAASALLENMARQLVATIKQIFWVIFNNRVTSFSALGASQFIIVMANTSKVPESLIVDYAKAQASSYWAAGYFTDGRGCLDSLSPTP